MEENQEPLPFEPRIRIAEGGRREIFDPVRRKFVSLTPEEGVRQQFLHFLMAGMGYPQSVIAVEAPLVYNKRKKRSDIVVFSRAGRPVMIVECKAPSVDLTPEVFQQAAMYNMALKVDYLVLTNGTKQITCRIDATAQKCRFMDTFPSYAGIMNL